VAAPRVTFRLCACINGIHELEFWRKMADSDNFWPKRCGQTATIVNILRVLLRKNPDPIVATGTIRYLRVNEAAKIVAKREGIDMKSTAALLSTSSLAVLAGSFGSQAADLPMKAAPMAVPTVSWTGFYAGVHGGAVWQQAHLSDDYTGFPGVTPSDSGGIAGGQIGYNWQNGNTVYGLEVDGSWVSGKPNASSYGYGYNGNDYGTVSSKIEWLSTVRGRLGLAVGNAMVYATGGLAIGGVKTGITLWHCQGCDDSQSVSNTNTQVGWTVGAGAEHKWSPNLSFGLEGLFVDLGKKTVALPGSKHNALNGDNNMNVTTRNQAFIGRVKANYKF
jgi:outer membrane immunogenic protein